MVIPFVRFRIRGVFDRKVYALQQTIFPTVIFYSNTNDIKSTCQWRVVGEEMISIDLLLSQ